MKALTIILGISLLFFYSCSEKSDNQNKTTKSTVVSLEKQSYTGKIIEYYTNGNKKHETLYAKGFPNGEYLTWFKDGTKKAEGVYDNGKRIGLWKWYNGKGKINFTVIYGDVSIADL